MFTSIGTRLKFLRKERKITLSQLAKQTRLSTGLLSYIERNLRSPSITNLHKICNILNITINELLQDGEDKLCVRKEERQTIFYEDTPAESLVYQSLISGTKSLKAMAQIIKDNQHHNSFKHSVDELGLVIEGSVIITIEETEYAITVGDSIFIPRNCHHSFKKSSEDICIIYWVSPNEV